LTHCIVDLEFNIYNVNRALKMLSRFPPNRGVYPAESIGEYKRGPPTQRKVAESSRVRAGNAYHNQGFNGAMKGFDIALKKLFDSMEALDIGRAFRSVIR
jgi:hypothetical protein